MESIYICLDARPTTVNMVVDKKQKKTDEKFYIRHREKEHYGEKYRALKHICIKSDKLFKKKL